MKLLELKNRLALETARLIAQNGIDVIFFGGTALNTFYLDYRYSEDLDLGYSGKQKKHEIEKLLDKYGYIVQRTDFDFRDIISLEGVSIKLDVVEYNQKYNGFTDKKIGETKIRTLEIEEFVIEKIVSFFTREDLAGTARDGYDLFCLEEKHALVLGLAKKEKKLIRKHISSLDYNVKLFESDIEKTESAVKPYLRKPVKARDVLDFLKNLRKVLK